MSLYEEADNIKMIKMLRGYDQIRNLQKTGIKKYAWSFSQMEKLCRKIDIRRKERNDYSHVTEQQKEICEF